MSGLSWGEAGTALPSTMKALIKRHEEEGYELEHVPLPEPVDDEVLLRVTAVSICGSDIALWRWNDTAREIATLPFTPGHECAGIVVKAAAGSSVPVGARVGVENHFYCGECNQCLEDFRETCVNMGQFGHGRKTEYGGCSEYSIVSSKYCYQLPEDITPEEAVLLEPLGVSHNAVEKLDVSGCQVLVLGCGPIGLLAIGVARCLGATQIFGVDIDEKRLSLAKEMGADDVMNASHGGLKEFVRDKTNGVMMDRICECSGAQPMISEMFDLLRKNGKVVMVGLPKQPIHIENPLHTFLFKTLTLRTVHGRRIYHTWRECVRLLQEKQLDACKVVSHTLPLTEFRKAFDTLFSGQGCKIVLDPSC